MRRHVLGILAIFFLVVGLILYIRPDLVDASSTWSGIGVRVGTVLAVTWLAYPHLELLPKSLVLIVVLSGIVLARWPRFFPIAIVVIVAIMILRPRSPRKQPPSKRPGS